jgi:hypothetical protein
MDPTARFDLGTVSWLVVYILCLDAGHDDYRFRALCCVVIAFFSKSRDCTDGPTHEIINNQDPACRHDLVSVAVRLA